MESPSLSRWTPTKRRVVISRLRALGFAGPFSGSRHQFMIVGEHRLTLPSAEEYSVDIVRRFVREVESAIGREITLEERQRL